MFKYWDIDKFIKYSVVIAAILGALVVLSVLTGLSGALKVVLIVYYPVILSIAFLGGFRGELI